MIALSTLLSCHQRRLPAYPATDDGIARMRLDSAALLLRKHDTRNAMCQLKAAEKHLFNVTEDSLKFTTYYRIALLNAENGAYRLALDYLNHAARHTDDSKKATVWQTFTSKKLLSSTKWDFATRHCCI